MTSEPAHAPGEPASRSSRFPERILLSVGVFNALSALVGGLVVSAVGLPMPLADIRPFTSFLIPGLLLLVVIGGTQAWAVVAQVRKHPHWPVATAVAGFGMLIWIFGEVAIVPGYSPLQGFYFGTGIVQLGFLLVRLGLFQEVVGRSNPAPTSPR